VTTTLNKTHMKQRTILLFIILLNVHLILLAQQIPSPKEYFGFTIGDNYKLATYTQTKGWFNKVAATSDRVKLVALGETEEGQTQYMLIVSSPENIKNIDRYKAISQKLARAEGISNEDANQMANEGKAVVWIDGGLHATETVGTHQLIETIWNFISRNDPETKRILDEVIILFVHANPDGQELVSNWYMRNSDTLKRSLSKLPVLYQKYAGHDNNRDFFIMNLKETRNMSRQLYIEWLPQILYNHHQAGPAGSVVAGPPYRDPFNYVYDPMVVSGIDAVGAAMSNRLIQEGKPGYTQRGGSIFSTWYNGGLRTTAYFHNIIGLLTEIIGSPTPSSVPLVPSRLLPNGATPYPVIPQKWTFRNSIDYSVSLNYAVLDYAARNREHLLYNMYLMGRNSIQKGNQDYWTVSPKRIEALNIAIKNDRNGKKSSDTTKSTNRDRVEAIPLKYYDQVFKDSSLRDPRGYIIQANQPDFPTAIKFVNALIQSGIKVQKATADFSVGNKIYPKGSYVIQTSQAFRPHVIDMFEPQDHPNDFSYPGGPPVQPYDAAGWTPAFTMGFVFDRIVQDFEGSFHLVPYGELQNMTGYVEKAKHTAGYILDSRINNSFTAVNDLLQAGVEVYRMASVGYKFRDVGQGSFFIPAKGKSASVLEKAISNLGIVAHAVDTRPKATMQRLTSSRIALFDRYGGSMQSGWTRWMFEQFHFPFSVVYPKEINAGSLRKKYDILVFVGDVFPKKDAVTVRDTSKTDDIPIEFRDRLGKISADTSITALKQFLESGGTIITIGQSTNLAYHLKLPVENSLVQIENGKTTHLPDEKYFIPGSVLSVQLDTTLASCWGLGSNLDVYFENSPVFKVAPDALAKRAVTPLAWFPSDKSLRSGWAWGQEYLKNGIAAFVAPVGLGKLYAFGPEIIFRAQTHGSFKLLFNQLFQDQTKMVK